MVSHPTMAPQIIPTPPHSILALRSSHEVLGVSAICGLSSLIAALSPTAGSRSKGFWRR